MRNKWYVAAILVPVALLLWGAVTVLRNEGGIWVVVPLGLAAALIVLAVRVARTASFAPAPPPERLGQVGSPSLERWKKQHSENIEAKSRSAQMTSRNSRP